MPRRKPPPEPTAAPPPPLVPVIDPNGLYVLETARQTCRLKLSTIRREWREGRLKISRRAGRVYILGKWLIEWIENGVDPPRKAESRRAK